MAKKKIDLKSLSVDELKSKSKEFKDQLFKLRMQFVTGQLANTASMRILRKDIARAKTFLAQKSDAQK